MSFTTFSLTMQDMKTEELGASASQQWQNYRIPLPTPSTRAPQTYDQHAPLSAPLISMYPGPAQENYSTMSPPHHDMPARRGSETVALSGSSRMHPGTALTSHRSYPTLKRPFGALEENHYSRNAAFVQEGMQEPENKPSIQSDHRLLSFSPLPQRTVVLDQYGAQAKIDVAAQIHGMFFLSEMPAHSGDGMVMQPELTCYRRNLFQISGSVSRSAGAFSVINERQESVPVVSQELIISAMESVDGHVIRLIVIPWKTPPVNSPEIPSGAEQEPIPIPLDFEGGEEEEDKNSTMVTQPISWRRLQFRVATANNGRRKELQQHFVLRLKVIATLADGTKACLNESTTSPIVVRGRSPRNFQARKEIPLVGSSASPRGQTTTVSPSTGKKSSLGPDRMGSGSTSIMELPKRQFQFDASNFPSAPSAMRSGFAQWNGPPQHSDQNTGVTTSNSLAPSSTMAPYMNGIQSFHPIPEATPPSTATSQAAPLGHQRHYYSSSSSLPGQYDSDSVERPTKSPRHSYMSNSSAYQNFETPFGAALPSNTAARQIYYSPVADSQPWAPPADASGAYAQALQPQPQHHPPQSHLPALPPPGQQSMQHHQQQAPPHIQQHSMQHHQQQAPPHIQQQQQQQQHQPPPQQHHQQGPPSYAYASETYPRTTRDDPQTLNSYNWSPAQQ